MAVSENLIRRSITLPKDFFQLIKEDAAAIDKPLSQFMAEIIMQHYEQTGRYTRPEKRNTNKN